MTRNWTVRDIPDQAGKVAIVTGGNTGLGFQTARHLAAAGAQVILAVRDERKGEDAVSRILAAYPAAKMAVRQLDLASLESVTAFATRLLAEHERLDLLINNAGVASPRERLTTRDGFELQFGVNFLGHYALTVHVLPMLRHTPASRVINLSSIMHRYGRIDFDDLMSERNYSPVRSYNQSRLATLIFARELARRSKRNGWQVLSVAAHPGVARTELTKSRPGQSALRFNVVVDALSPLFAGTAESGAMPTLLAATSPSVLSGEYYGPTGWGEIKGPPGPATSTADATDPEIAERLWSCAEKYTGLRA